MKIFHFYNVMCKIIFKCIIQYIEKLHLCRRKACYMYCYEFIIWDIVCLISVVVSKIAKCYLAPNRYKIVTYYDQ